MNKIYSLLVAAALTLAAPTLSYAHPHKCDTEQKEEKEFEECGIYDPREDPNRTGKRISHKLCSIMENLTYFDLSFNPYASEGNTSLTTDSRQHGRDSFVHYLKDHAGFSLKEQPLVRHRNDKSIKPERQGGRISWHYSEKGPENLEISLFCNEEIIRKGRIPYHLLEEFAAEAHGSQRHTEIADLFKKVVPSVCEALKAKPDVPFIDLSDSVNEGNKK